ncbi:MAG: NADH-quinone oxidoreductase subunit C [Fimbriimonadaceae bacterium]|nr:NADH-quinone oxidoreductase subunit C [Fimbriimonadaceae bacterium]
MDDLAPALTATLERLRGAFGEQLQPAAALPGNLTLEVPLDLLLPVVRFLRDSEDLAYRHLSDLTAVDRLPRQPRFDMVYHLLSLATAARLRLRVAVAEAVAVPSLTGLWKGANYLEREVFDMFGIPFSGHPNLERILTPDGFEGHPLRRDFSLGSEPVTFDIPHRKRFSDAAN